jgi:hypothetical protein
MRELLFEQELVASAPDDFQLFESFPDHNCGEAYLQLRTAKSQLISLSSTALT